MDGFQLSMIQKAIHRTYDELGKELDFQSVATDEIQKGTGRIFICVII